MKKQHDILEQAIEAFQKTTGLVILAHSQTALTIAHNQRKYHFKAKIQLNLTKTTLAFFAHDASEILITNYVTPQMSEQMKNLGMAFIDTAGNAYLNKEHLFIYVKGCKRKQPLPQARLKRPFKAAGLHVIFALLCNPGLENTPFRNIAKAANVALGSVEAVIQDLKQMGYLIEREKRKRQLYQKRALLERWTTAYPEQLRPKLLINHYQSIAPNWWQEAQLNTNTFWGGEIAAAILTHYLKPMRATVYIKQSVGEFVLKNRLRKMPQGEVEILETFWGFEYPHNLVPPLLIYADLIATGNARNIETAKIIYEKELVGLIQAS